MTNNSDGTSTPFNEVDFETAIEQYATAYERLDRIQKSQSEWNGKDGKYKLIPVGDQKTGAIGEYYALKYLRKHLKGSDDTVFIGKNPSQAGWDIVHCKNDSACCKNPNEYAHENCHKYSVKTVSSYSDAASCLVNFAAESVWSYLIIVRLDKCFRPIFVALYERKEFKGEKVRFYAGTEDLIATDGQHGLKKSAASVELFDASELGKKGLVFKTLIPCTP